MRLRRLFLLLCIPVVWSTSAAADDAFDAFKIFCVATHADGKLAIAAADKAGWEKASDDVLASVAALGNMKDREGRAHRTGSGVIALVVNNGKMSSGDPFGGKACDIAVAGDRTATWRPLAASLAAVPPDAAMSKEEPTYVWQITHGSHVALRDDAPDVMAQFESGRLNILAVRHSRFNTSMLSLIVPSKEQ